MNELMESKIKILESLFKQKAQIEAKIIEIMSSPNYINQVVGHTHIAPAPIESVPSPIKRRATDSFHSKVEKILHGHPEGATTETIFRDMKASYPEMNFTQKEVTASLVYLTHKRDLTERLGQGIYKLK